MEDKIYFEHVAYISSNEAADCFGVTRDYITKLCRDGKIISRQVGKKWYVAETPFKEYLLHHLYTKSARRESLTKTRVKEYHDGSASQQFKITRIPIRTPRTEQEAALRDDPSVPFQKRMTDALISQTTETAQEISPYMNVPSGITHAALQATHIPIYTITPVAEILHKFSALFLSLLFLMCAYGLIHPTYTHTVLANIGNGADLIASPQGLAVASENMNTLTSVSAQRLSALAANSLHVFSPSKVFKTANATNVTLSDLGQRATSYGAALLSGTVSSVQGASSTLGSSVSVSVRPIEPQTSPTLHTDTLCVGDVCITQDQFLNMVRMANQTRATTTNLKTNTFRPIVTSSSTVSTSSSVH